MAEAGQLIKAPSFETPGDWYFDDDGAPYNIAHRLCGAGAERTGNCCASVQCIRDFPPGVTIYEGSVSVSLWTGRPRRQHDLVFWTQKMGRRDGILRVEVWDGSEWRILREVDSTQFSWADYRGFEVVFVPQNNRFSLRFTAVWTGVASSWYLDDVQCWDAVGLIPPSAVPGAGREEMMAIGSVEICNLALAIIGVGDSIASLEEDSENARLCRRFYTFVRDAVLEDVDWRFASRRKALVKVDDSDEVTEWAYRYQYPTDCLVMREILPGKRAVRADQRIPYVVESDADHGLVILTDQGDAIARYTAKLDDPSWWPKSFIDYLVYELALKLAHAKRSDRSIVQEIVSLSQMAKGKAIAMNSRQAQKDPDPDARHIAERTA